MIVIILNGPGESGKGKFVELLTESFNLSFTKYSSIAWAKMVAQKHFGWNDQEKTPQDREMIGEIKRLGIKYGDIPTKKVLAMFRRSYANHDDLFVTDIREPTEIKKLVDHFKIIKIKCVTIRIQNTEREQYAAKNLGIADNEYANYNYNFIIPNNGTIEEFRQTIISAMETGALTFTRRK